MELFPFVDVEVGRVRALSIIRLRLRRRAGPRLVEQKQSTMSLGTMQKGANQAEEHGRRKLRLRQSSSPLLVLVFFLLDEVDDTGHTHANLCELGGSVRQIAVARYV